MGEMSRGRLIRRGPYFEEVRYNYSVGTTFVVKRIPSTDYCVCSLEKSVCLQKVKDGNLEEMAKVISYDT